jgi:GNAT superfamily N-acetyltransferase
MRDHLERIGRFDPDRARAHFVAGFVPADMRLIHVRDRFAGCVSLGADAGGLELAHFYLHPDFQGRGLGSAVLDMLLTGTDAADVTVRLAVLRQSPARRFYERRGFVLERQGEWDDFLIRRPVPRILTPSPS